MSISAPTFGLSVPGSSGGAGLIALPAGDLAGVASTNAVPTLGRATAPTSDVAPTDTVITGQPPYAAAGVNKQGASLVFNGAAPVGGASELGTAIKIKRAGTLVGQIGYYGSGYSAVWLGNAIVPSGSNFCFLSEGANYCYLNCPNSSGGISLSFNGSGSYGMTLNGPSATPANQLAWAPGAVTPSLSQQALGSDVATTTLTVQAQSAYASAVTNKTGGNLVLQGGAGVVSTGINGAVYVKQSAFKVDIIGVVTTGGTTTLTPAQTGGIIETSGALAGSNAIIELPAIVGSEWTLFNNNSGGFTTTFRPVGGTGFAVAQGKRATGYINGSNVLVRTGADV